MYVLNAKEKYELWKEIPPNTILFRKNRDDVYHIINNAIEDNKKNPIVNDSTYKKIKVYIDKVMFDGLANRYSEGFFDEDDMPPPELWIDFKDNYLIALIPQKFEAIVEECVRESMSESIEWI